MRIMGHLHTSRISFFGAVLSSEQIGTGSRHIDSHQRGAFRLCELKHLGTLHTWICSLCNMTWQSWWRLRGTWPGLFCHRCWPALLANCLWRHQWTKLRFGVIKWNSVKHQNCAMCTKCLTVFGYSAALEEFVYVVCCYEYSDIKK